LGESAEQLERKDHSTLAAYRRYARLRILPVDEYNSDSPERRSRTQVHLMSLEVLHHDEVNGRAGLGDVSVWPACSVLSDQV
jgi:hypothetical protein